MDQMSGGEKTLAALTLLFAVNSYRTVPFFILDEVDAALDAQNVDRVRKYVAKRAGRSGGLAGEGGMQFIVISLKDRFFSWAKNLVGVAKHPEINSSMVFTHSLQTA
jgi:structural maintenance of chromosome 1